MSNVVAFKRKLKPPLKRKSTKPRTYLREDEIEAMIGACKCNRYAVRDELVILLSFRHGLRSIELVELQWPDIDLDGQVIHIRRAKGSTDGAHPLSRREVDLLDRLRVAEIKRYRHDVGKYTKPLLKTSTGRQLSRRLVRHIVATAGREAGIPFPVSPHMLRHSCGYWLSDKGADLRVIQAYLGHVNVQHTTGYVALSPHRYRELYWQD